MPPPPTAKSPAGSSPYLFSNGIVTCAMPGRRGPHVKQYVKTTRRESSAAKSPAHISKRAPDDANHPPASPSASENSAAIVFLRPVKIQSAPESVFGFHSRATQSLHSRTSLQTIPSQLSAAPSQSALPPTHKHSTSPPPGLNASYHVHHEKWRVYR